VTRRKQPEYVLVAVGSRSRLSTGPALVTDQAALSQLREIGTLIETIGVGTAMSMTFLGKPTMDLLVETSDPKGTARVLESALAA
jgi:hypothetical protein